MASTSTSSGRHQLQGSLLIPPTLREHIHRSQLWKHHVANSSLKWIIAKVRYADRIGPDAKRSDGQFNNTAALLLSSQRKLSNVASDSVKASPQSSAGLKRTREAEDSDDSDIDDEQAADNADDLAATMAKGNAAAQFLAEMEGSVVATEVDRKRKQQALASAAAAAASKTAIMPMSSVTSKDVDEEDFSASLYGNYAASALVNAVPTGIDQPVHRAPHVLYAASFTEAAAGSTTDDGATTSTKAGNSSSALSLKPEMFLCLLYRALQLSKEISDAQIVEMVAQKHDPTSNKTSSTDGNDLGGSKYCRVFGLFLARMLLAQRGRPDLLKACWDIARTDFRKVRLVGHLSNDTAVVAGGNASTTIPNADDEVVVVGVDEVAHALFTSSRWDRIVLPSCKPL